MPDISKLKELSEIFGVTVDEILGGGTHSELVRELIEKQPVRKATREEIEEIAPILHEAQVETLLNGSDRCEADIDMVASLAPYLSQAYIDRYALSLLNKYNTFRAIGRIAPLCQHLRIGGKGGRARKTVRQPGCLRACYALSQQPAA